MDKLSHPAKKAPWSRTSELSWLPPPSPYTRIVLGMRVEASGTTPADAPGGAEASDALRCFRRWRWPVIHLR